MKSNQTQEIEFIFSLMRELLEEVAPEIREIFIALKEDKTADYAAKKEVLKELESKDISKLIKAFTLYYLLLNIVDERHLLSFNSKEHIGLMLDELKDILGKLFIKYGLTSEVVRLSEVIDTLINKEMRGLNENRG